MKMKLKMKTIKTHMDQFKILYGILIKVGRYKMKGDRNKKKLTKITKK